MRVLDVGCGTGAMVPFLGAVDYLGLDHNAGYVARARQTHGKAGVEFRCASVEDLYRMGEPAFDRVLILGVLHHLSDAVCQSLLFQVASLLKAEGMALTVDVCYHPDQPGWARWLTSLDRGRYVRLAEGYAALASDHFTGVEQGESRSLYLRRTTLRLSRPCPSAWRGPASQSHREGVSSDVGT